MPLRLGHFPASGFPFRRAPPCRGSCFPARPGPTTAETLMPPGRLPRSDKPAAPSAPPGPASGRSAAGAASASKQPRQAERRWSGESAMRRPSWAVPGRGRARRAPRRTRAAPAALAQRRRCPRRRAVGCEPWPAALCRIGGRPAAPPDRSPLGRAEDCATDGAREPYSSSTSCARGAFLARRALRAGGRSRPVLPITGFGTSTSTAPSARCTTASMGMQDCRFVGLISDPSLTRSSGRIDRPARTSCRPNTLRPDKFSAARRRRSVTTPR